MDWGDGGSVGTTACTSFVGHWRRTVSSMRASVNDFSTGGLWVRYWSGTMTNGGVGTGRRRRLVVDDGAKCKTGITAFLSADIDIVIVIEKDWEQIGACSWEGAGGSSDVSLLPAWFLGAGGGMVGWKVTSSPMIAVSRV